MPWPEAKLPGFFHFYHPNSRTCPSYPSFPVASPGMPFTLPLPRVSKTPSTSPWMAVCGSRWRAQWNQARTWPSVRAQADQEVYKREGRQWWQRGIRILSSHLWPSHPRRENEDLHMRDGKRAWWNGSVNVGPSCPKVCGWQTQGSTEKVLLWCPCEHHFKDRAALLEDGLMFFNFWGQWWRRCFCAGPRPGILDLGIMICVNLYQVILGCGALCHILYSAY